MLTYTTDTWTVRSQMILRVVLSALVLVCALLVYPAPTIILAFIALFAYRAYEVLLAGILLDALLAPGNGMLGDYTYTALFVGGSIGIHAVRYLMRGSRTL